MAAVPHATGMGHFPVYPKGFVFIRYVQLLFSVACLGLCGYLVGMLTSIGSVFMLFTAVTATIVGIWIITAHSCAKAAYNYWAVLVSECIFVVLWLVSFALAADNAKTLFEMDSLSTSGSSRNPFQNEFLRTYIAGSLVIHGTIFAVASGCGALNFILYLATLIIHSRALYKHRRAGGKALRAKSTPNPVGQEDYRLDAEGKMTYQPTSYYNGSVSQRSTTHGPHAVYAEAASNQVQPAQQLSADRPVAELQSSDVPVAELSATTQHQQYPMRYHADADSHSSPQAQPASVYSPQPTVSPESAAVPDERQGN